VKGVLKTLTPYVLRERKELPPENSPSPDEVYDESRQLWIDKSSGLPLVSCMQKDAQATTYGETTYTKTREGADQTESVYASRFGETTQTHTVEGIDKTEVTAIQASQFGETISTRTREGTDQSEGGTRQDFDDPYSHF
jgi:hypothetical protein